MNLISKIFLAVSVAVIWAASIFTYFNIGTELLLKDSNYDIFLGILYVNVSLFLLSSLIYVISIYIRDRKC